MNEQKLILTWITDKNEINNIKPELTLFDYDYFEKKGIDGSEETIRWVVEAILGSELIKNIITFILNNLKKNKSNLTIQIGEDIIIKNASPKQTIELLKKLKEAKYIQDEFTQLDIK